MRNRLTLRSLVRDLPKGPVRLEDLLKLPIYHLGPITYHCNALFRRISMGNLSSYTTLAVNDEFTHMVSAHLNFGWVFLNSDLKAEPPLGALPVLSVHLDDSGIKGYKRARRLCIRQTYARRGAACEWYIAFAKKFGGVVSDTEHLEGGKRRWELFVRAVVAERGLKVSLVNTHTRKYHTVTSEKPDEAVGSLDAARKCVVWVLEQPRSPQP